MIVTYVCSSAVEDQYQVIWRCATLAEAIQRTGLHQASVIDLEAFVRHTPEAQAACNRADLIVIHRYLSATVMEAVLHWKACGKKVIVDLDEPLHQVLPDRTPALPWQPADQHTPVGGEPGSRLQALLDEPFSASLRLVDAITSPSARLADDWEVPVPVFHVPDYLDFRRYLDLKPTREKSIRIGLGGSCVPYASMAESGLLGALVQVCQQRPNVKLMLFGADQSLIRYLNRTAIPKVVHHWVPAEDWPHHLSKMDIGLAPIAGDIERRKSWQRLMEYMILSIPWVASDQLPYRSLGSYGCLVRNTESAWTQALLDVIDRLDAYREKASKEAFVFALGLDVDENISKVITQYRSILDLPSG